MGWLVKALVASILLSLGFEITESAPESALVTKLPGFNGSFPSKHYAGYVAIYKERNKNLWYYFVESERNASGDPVVLWLNGGPGCSSMDGFIYEHGPFNFDPTKTKSQLLHLNRFSWSKVSNIIYLDSPVGVGYSYSKDKSDYNTNDTKTASDSYAFLVEWFKMFPEFQSNPLFISGESYAGIYVPTLASEVVKGHKNVTKPLINLKGYLVGNGVTDPVFDGNALVPFAHGMGLISNELFEETKAECKGQYFNEAIKSDKCAHFLEKVSEGLRGLNVYNILEPCYHETSTSSFDIGSLPSSFHKLGETERPLRVRKRMFGRAWPFDAVVRPGIVPSWPQLLANSTASYSAVACTDDRVATAWLNDPAVRQAVHAKKETEIGRWVLCTDQVGYAHDAGSMIEYHRNLTLSGYRALIFSGDHDMCVPYTGSEAWTKSMGYKVVDEWRPWMSNDQVAGFTQGYDNNLTFLTVKGSGHTVPEYKPHEALDFYSRFLAGEKI
ncbi:serine carboxypeptidase-like 21 isoform X1 [Eutrema salsugineum]|uniref:serine carboxypeptidase-like 21 isoform X1 n=1 Tax=Eutrema salsugineum TaxID=72664 RepID=UPI000CED4493|nr:serine carboxypeptidase-like 21 isoform X1 [Eutrema salsugineum]